MKLIADSGSTKTNWCLLGSEDSPGYILTGGFNPYFRSSDDIAEEVERLLAPNIKEIVSNIYFYGAGVTDASKGEIVREALGRFFPVAKIETESDLLAAARATCGREPGIACILGTGSNSCYYDGEKIADQVSPLGFILGDEGSGAVMGRKLVGDYLKRIMPAELRDEFRKMYPIEPAEFLERVYRQPRPNKFLADFTRFLSAFIQHEYCPNFVRQNFREFVDRNLLSYPFKSEVSIHFIGSLAFYFREILLEVLKDKGLHGGLILKEPMEGLIRYHSNIKSNHF